MLPDEKAMCHHTAFEKRCFDMVTICKCPKWIGIQGMNPQTGEQMMRYGCADGLQHHFAIENNSLLNQIAASLQSERNEITKRLDVGNVLSAGSRQLLGAAVRIGVDDQRAIGTVTDAVKLIEDRSDGS